MGFGHFIKYTIISIITITLLSGCDNIKFFNTHNDIKEYSIEIDEKNITINYDDTFSEIVNNNQTINKIKIATCPTFQKYLENNNIQLTKTNSTSESLYHLQNGNIDFALGGRTTKPLENFPNQITLGSGYSFLAKQSITIGNQELQTINFYTDLNDLKNIKEIFGIKNLEKVENIYDYIDQNIIITSRENTDYTRGDIVHVLHPNGERYIESRIPILYCREECDDYIIGVLTKLLSYKY